MRGLWRHAWVRLAATIRSPYALAVVVLSGLATLALSPTLPLVAVAADEPIDRIILPIVTTQWLWLWPALITRAVSGRTTGAPWSAVEPPLPQLPVGPRARMLAEVLVVCGLMLVVRSAGFCFGSVAEVVPGLPIPTGVGYGLTFAAQWPMDVLVFAPVVAAWSFPTRSQGMVMFRPLLAALAVYAGVLAGAYDHLATATLLSVLLLVVMVAPWGRDLSPVGAVARRFVPRGPSWRPARSSQLVRDLVWLPLARNAAVVLAALVGQVLLLAGEALGPWPPMIFHMGSSLVFGLLLAHVVLRPLGSPMLMSSVSGLGKHRLGDFAAAWSVLPVQRHAVLRGVYAHGLVGGLLLWAMMTGVFYARAWLELGAAVWTDPETVDAALLLLPAACVAPMLAGLLVSLAAGARGFGIAVGVMLVGYLPVQLVLSKHVGEGLSIGLAAPILLATVLGAASGLPPLLQLRRTRRTG